MDYDKAMEILKSYSKPPGSVRGQVEFLEYVYGPTMNGRRVVDMSDSEIYGSVQRIWRDALDTSRQPMPAGQDTQQQTCLESIDSHTLGVWAAEMKREGSVSDDEKAYTPDDCRRVLAELDRRGLRYSPPDEAEWPDPKKI